MIRRVLTLARALLTGEWLGARLPVAPVVFLAVVAALMAALVRDEVGAYGFAVVAFAVPLALVTLPLLGELAPILRADPAAEWVGSLPLRPRELRAARVLVVLAILGALALACMLPAAALAPAGTGVAARAYLVVAGVVQTWFVASALLVAQGVLGRRAEGVLVVLQTALFLVVLVGFLAGIRRVGLLAELEGATPAMLAFPPAWFAAPLAPAGPGVAGWLAAGAVLFAAGVLAIAPFPPAPTARRTGSPVASVLAPLRSLAVRVWVRREERAAFDFVYDALPAERDFATRSYPLVAAPLAFLLLGANPSTVEGRGLFALLLFAPATYVPLVLMHVPATGAPAARWLLDTAPLDPAVEDRAAYKALAVRIVAPLYVGLALLVGVWAGWDLAGRLAPVAAATTLVVARVTWPLVVEARPLSRPAQDLGSAWTDRLMGVLLTIAVATTLLGIAAWRLVPSPAFGIGVLVLWAAWEVASSRRAGPSAHAS